MTYLLKEIGVMVSFGLVNIVLLSVVVVLISNGQFGYALRQR